MVDFSGFGDDECMLLLEVLREFWTDGVRRSSDWSRSCCYWHFLTSVLGERRCLLSEGLLLSLIESPRQLNVYQDPYIIWIQPVTIRRMHRSDLTSYYFLKTYTQSCAIIAGRMVCPKATLVGPIKSFLGGEAVSSCLGAEFCVELKINDRRTWINGLCLGQVGW